jgi:hypothetical protein
MTPQIKTLEFSRYRGFRDPQSVKISALTLVYGENNAGKSALVRLPKLIAASRVSGQPGINLNSSVVKGAGFREIQWGGKPPKDEDTDLILGMTLSDGSQWSWTFQWQELSGGARIQRLQLSDPKLTLEHESNSTYRDQDGKEHTLKFDGLIPRPYDGYPAIVQNGSLSDALDKVTWLGASRIGPSREGLQRGRTKPITETGDGAAEAFLLDDRLRQRVSLWFREHTKQTVDVVSVAELQRIVLRSISCDIPLPDAGEGLQQVFPLVVVLEQLRKDGGLLVVEEPESHLHPRLQRALAELIVDILAEQPAASVMIETHSEVFLLAALIASIKKLPGHVHLYWVESKEETSLVNEIPITKDGYPSNPQLEQAFDVMGVMRRELIWARRDL